MPCRIILQRPTAASGDGSSGQNRQHSGRRAGGGWQWSPIRAKANVFQSCTVRGRAWYIACVLVLLWLIGSARAVAAAEPPATAHRVESMLGVTHVAGTYHLTDKPFLIEGAEQIARLPCRVIKLYLTVPPRQYPFNEQWPATETLVDVAETPSFRAVFRMPFSTYILTTYAAGRPDHYWLDGIDADRARDESEQFYRLAKHLLTTYRGSGKTFILQHWEGDWAVRGQFDPHHDPSKKAIEGMIGWLRARQQGVERAREELGHQGVAVFHAAEVNLVQVAMEEHRPTVTTHVLPHVRVDLVSYSAWDTQGDAVRFRRALDFIADHAIDSPHFGSKNVYVGEFGAPENEWSEERIKQTIRNVIGTASRWGCPYVVYWQVYCNEPRHKPVRKNDDVRGFWLIRPDGSKAVAWYALREYLAERAAAP